jgi:hypothetical protein
MNPRAMLWALVLPFCAVSCKDTPEAIPSYLTIQPFVVDADGGAGWQKITEGWLYVNGEFLGAYTLPASVPALAEGDSEVQIFPGVRQNGIAETPNIYPFLKRYVQHIDLVPGEARSITPSTSYDNTVQYPWTFDRSSFDFGSTIPLENRDSDADNSFAITADGAFSGKCVLMNLDTTHALMEIATEAITLPTTYAQEVWMELHFRNDVPFYLYIIGLENGAEVKQPLYAFKVKDAGVWNKIYLNLTETLLTFNHATEYRLFFQAGLPVDQTGKVTQDSGQVRLDNLRLLHY